MARIRLIVWMIGLFGLVAFAAPRDAQAARPGWIVSCSYSHSLPDDPIVAPGQPDASHLHDFVGARTTDAHSTAKSLRASDTSCAVSADRSAYWVPALFVNGRRMLPTASRRHALFYYRRHGVPAHATVATIPDGLKIIVGNAHAQSPEENPQLGTDIIFKCGLGSTTDLPAPPSRCASGVMSVSLRFPNCWDGINLDSPDHRSHMAYPVKNRCPATHPVNIPRLESFIRYPIGPERITKISFVSGPYYTLHQDFFNGWDPDALQRLIDHCINGGVDCGKNPDIPGPAAKAAR